MSSARASGTLPSIHRKVTSTLRVFCNKKTMSPTRTAAALQLPIQPAPVRARRTRPPEDVGERSANPGGVVSAPSAGALRVRWRTDKTSPRGRPAWRAPRVGCRRFRNSFIVRLVRPAALTFCATLDHPPEDCAAPRRPDASAHQAVSAAEPAVALPSAEHRPTINTQGWQSVWGPARGAERRSFWREGTDRG
jgi:hypothetical protein